MPALSCGILMSFLASSASAQEVTANRQRASQLYNNITGKFVSIDSPKVVEMERILNSGKSEREAAKIATQDTSFVDVRMMNFARRMWSTTESYGVINNDFIATTAGAARDGVDARELLTGNFYYEYDISDLDDRDRGRFGTVIREGQPNNAHYESAVRLGYSESAKLIRTTPHMVFRDVANPDSGGLLSTRSFIVEYATGGTNRRLVEYTFRSFMCVEMQDWMDATRPDDKVGRDVDRFAGGSTERYQTTCKGCHAQLDAFRPAFAFVGVSSRTPAVNTVGRPNASLARNATIFPQGYTVGDSKWKNYATSAVNADRFGWRGNVEEGTGVQAFGKLIGNSQGFSRCMVRRMFYEICKREADPFEENAIRNMATQFEATYKFRDLAEIVATNNICLKRGAR
jgi:hypothetical protein